MSHALFSRLYPRAYENRLTRPDAAQKVVRTRLWKAAGLNFILLQLLFLGLFSWIFGSLFQQEPHVHNLSIAFVDYDGGAVGNAIRTAYRGLRGDGFPTLLEQPPADFPISEDLRNAVCNTQFWAGLYVSAGASDRLEGALLGTNTSYDKTNVLTYVWNEARYSAIVDSTVSGPIQTLSSAARIAYVAAGMNGTGSLHSLSDQAIGIVTNPWTLVSNNIQATTQGSRAVYNSVVFILIMMQEFFYLGTINGLHAQLKIYNRVAPHRIILMKNIISVSYTFVGGLCTAGAIWAFRAGWNVNGNQFVLTWLAAWLFGHLNFQAMDVFTIWLPHPYVPMALVFWIVVNVTSILVPLQLSPGFYHIGYAFPAHELYQVLTDIWSGGCNPHLSYALPIMFSWEVVGLCLAALGVFRRCHLATLGEEKQGKELKERIDAAVQFEMGRRDQQEAKPALAEEVPTTEKKPSISADKQFVEQNRLRDELTRIITTSNSRTRREQAVLDKSLDFGPCFALPFSASDNLKESEQESPREAS